MLQVKETYINATKGWRFGESPWQDYGYDDRGELYHALQREYGRCVGRIYVDIKPDGPNFPFNRVQSVGWVFHSRQRYADARSNDDTYLREVWCEVREVSDEHD